MAAVMERRCIDVALQIAQIPRRTGEIVKRGDILDHARAVPVQRDAIRIRRLVQIEFDVDVPQRRVERRKLMQQLALILARFNCVVLARQPIDDVDAHARLSDAVA